MAGLWCPDCGTNRVIGSRQPGDAECLDCGLVAFRSDFRRAESDSSANARNGGADDSTYWPLGALPGEGIDA